MSASSKYGDVRENISPNRRLAQALSVQETKSSCHSVVTGARVPRGKRYVTSITRLLETCAREDGINDRVKETLGHKLNKGVSAYLSCNLTADRNILMKKISCSCHNSGSKPGICHLKTV